MYAKAMAPGSSILGAGERTRYPPVRDGRGWQSGDTCTPHSTSWVISGKSPICSSLPCHLCNGWMQLLPLQCGSNETKLVTTLHDPQVCCVFGGIMLFLAITCSPGSPENLGLLGFAGRASEDRFLSHQRGHDLLKATGATCLLQSGCSGEWRVRHVGLALCPAPEFSAPSLQGKDTPIPAQRTALSKAPFFRVRALEVGRRWLLEVTLGTPLCLQAQCQNFWGSPHSFILKNRACPRPVRGCQGEAQADGGQASHPAASS